MLHEIKSDEHGPLGAEMSSAVSTCVHCGFCLAACPTYQELGQEADSPRGRIVLMKEVLEGKLAAESAIPHIDPCLGCLACEPACPSGVLYRDLISPFRALTEDARQRGIAERLRRAVVQMTLPYPRRFRLAALTGRFGRPFARWLPRSLRTMLELLPASLPAKQTWKEFNPAVGNKRGRVGLLTGCAQTVLAPDINSATIDVLTRNGVEVIVPKRQGCCGALSWHVGSLPQAQAFAKNNLNAFADVDTIVTNAAGCGSGMQEYHLILKGTADEDRARDFHRKVCDVSVFLTSLGGLQPLPNRGCEVRVAYHDACHLANAQNVRIPPRDLLRIIPGVELCEIPESHFCCGSAGTYNIDQPEIAHSLGQQKVDHILSINPDVVATGNIGCMTQLTAHLAKRDSTIPVRHTIQILRDAYRAV